MAELKETNIDIINIEKLATVSSSEIKQINKIKKLHETHPDEVDIIIEPENNHGVIVAKMPKSYIKISPPRKQTMTDDQKAALVERLAAARNKES